MGYQGGKERIAKHIVEVIGPVNGLYVEPFMGFLSVGRRIQADKYWFNDKQAPLKYFFEAWIDGWRPDKELSTKERYDEYKQNQVPEDPWTTWFGCCMSYSNKWFGGWTGNERTVKSGSQTGQIFETFKYGHHLPNKTAAALHGKDYEFTTLDYQDMDIPDGATVYCDPPYAGTTGYKTGSFDNEAFWAWAESLSQRCTVYVSEEKAPEGWKSVWSCEKVRGLKGNASEKSRIVVEHLFVFDKG